MTKRKFWRYLTRVHRYAGLVLGIQITLWFASGFFMSFFDIENVRGEHIAEKAKWELSEFEAVPVETAAAHYSGQLESVSLISVVGEPAYVLSGDKGERYINARTGEIWLPPGETTITLAASRYYLGDAKISEIKKITENPPIEYRSDLPVWQVTYDDKPKTRLYITAETAELKAVRTRLWRAFDFLWMLHIMDYKTRDNINNWWLWLLSGLAFLFAISGLALVTHRVFLRPRRLKG